MTKTLRNIQKLKQQFPLIWMRPGELFAPGYANTIWTGEGSEIGDAPAFCSWGYRDTRGVHPELARALDQMGLYADFYDGGTVFIYQR